jgi:2-methylcitrate dehydratase PrpD
MKSASRAGKTVKQETIVTSSATTIKADNMNARLAAFICDFDASSLPERTVGFAISAIVDTLAVTAAGRVEVEVKALEGSLPVYACAKGSERSSRGKTWRDDDAALLLGTASHVLDYDDVSMVTVCHPSAPVLSAMCAAICYGDLPPRPSGREFITALCIGTEVMIRVGQAMGFRHYELGFHPTATLGNIGATAALARLNGLGREKTAHALSIAASMSGGLRNNFGSMVKPLHVGLAAANGLRAVQLAQAGMTGAADIFEGSGFLFAFSGGVSSAWPAHVEPGKPFVLESPGFEQKRYPCCYILHKIIEASVALRNEHGLVLDQITGARVELPHGGKRPLNHPYPKSGLNGKFSAPYAVLASILDGRVNLASFVDEAVLRPIVQSRLADVEVLEVGAASNEGSDLSNGPVTVTLTLNDGRVVSRTVTLPPGSPSDPITPAQMEQKWVDCFRLGRPELTEAAARGLFVEGNRLDGSACVFEWLAAVCDVHLPSLKQVA